MFKNRYRISLFLLLGLVLAACGETPQPTRQPITSASLPVSQSVTSLATATALPTLPTGANAAQPISNAYLYYLKDNALWSATSDGLKQTSLAQNVVSYLQVGGGSNGLVFFQRVDDALQLKFVRLAAGVSVQEIVLDKRAFTALAVSSKAAAGIYGVDNRAVGLMALSPDNSQVAYTKANQAVSFDGLSSDEEHPTELWVASLASNATPSRLVANDKDYIATPTWSTDGNRIAFGRATNFGTGAGYATSIWSVYNDGSRLAFLTGPSLSPTNKAYQASPALNLRWVGPLALAFQANGRLWLHNLALQSDYPVLLESEAGLHNVYCSEVGRYVYIKQSLTTGVKGGLYSVLVGQSVQKSLVIDPKATEVLDCQANTLLYRNEQGEVILQSLNADGTLPPTKIKLATSFELDTDLLGAIAPDKRHIALASSRSKAQLSLFRADGTMVELSGTNPNLQATNLVWHDSQIVSLVGQSKSGPQLVAVDLSSAKIEVKIVDTAKDRLSVSR